MSFSVFIHGLESSNQGTKAVYFKNRYPEMIIPHFSGSLEERMDQLNGILLGKSGLRLVGSSFGGLMGSIFAMENESRVDRLILLAPALNLMAFSNYKERAISLPVWVYQGKNDEVIPLRAVERVSRRCFRSLTFHAVDDDHFLHRTFKSIEWDRLLS